MNLSELGLELGVESRQVAKKNFVATVRLLYTPF